MHKAVCVFEWVGGGGGGGGGSRVKMKSVQLKIYSTL